MRDEYTELIEEQARIDRDFAKQRRWYEQLHAEQDEVKQKLYVLRERIITAQGEQCAYCGAYLRSNRSYQHDQKLKELEQEGDIDRETLAARRAEDPVPYLYRVPVHIRLKVPKTRGGFEVMENLVACCARCGPRKHNKTHEEFISLMERERGQATVRSE